jgi:hypothetical protein
LSNAIYTSLYLPIELKASLILGLGPTPAVLTEGEALCLLIINEGKGGSSVIVLL